MRLLHGATHCCLGALVGLTAPEVPGAPDGTGHPSPQGLSAGRSCLAQNQSVGVPPVVACTPVQQCSKYGAAMFDRHLLVMKLHGGNSKVLASQLTWPRSSPADEQAHLLLMGFQHFKVVVSLRTVAAGCFHSAASPVPSAGTLAPP